MFYEGKDYSVLFFLCLSISLSEISMYGDLDLIEQKSALYRSQPELTVWLLYACH